ncbi:amidase signature domain-containing protein [Xylariaceae sp. FL0255]|nr:amidase signature domain-containing protein [Xylariaceae sp. FL0255]
MSSYGQGDAGYTSHAIDVLTTTAQELQGYLKDGSLTSKIIVLLYYQQINRHNKTGAKLNAMISTAPLDQLIARATELDKERLEGRVRSPLHGIPIIVKDSIITESSLEMATTCGSLAGGFRKDDTFLGHSNPCGSSSGSAAGVAAGFAPSSLRTETDGSIIQPTGRNSVYGLKITVGAVSTWGTLPRSDFTDSLDPMARSVPDLASLLGILMKKDFTKFLVESWSGQSVAFVDPYLWEAPENARLKYLEAAALIGQKGGKVVRDADMIQYEELEVDGQPGIDVIWDHDFAQVLERFFRSFGSTSLRKLEDVIIRSGERGDVNPQTRFIDALNRGGIDHKECEAAKRLLRAKARHAFDQIFSKQGVDLLAMPQDCRIAILAAAAGYPAGIVPLGYAPFNGRGFGLVVIAGEKQEAKILSFMSAWQATHPGLPTPPQLVEDKMEDYIVKRRRVARN